MLPRSCCSSHDTPGHSSVNISTVGGQTHCQELLTGATVVYFLKGVPLRFDDVHSSSTYLAPQIKHTRLKMHPIRRVKLGKGEVMHVCRRQAATLPGHVQGVEGSTNDM